MEGNKGFEHNIAHLFRLGIALVDIRSRYAASRRI